MSTIHSYTAPGGTTIAYELTGRGRPVGYAHGVLFSTAAVRGLDLFDVDVDAIAADRRLLTYDQRRHDHSGGRAIAEDYRFENAAADLLGVLDTAAIDQPIDFAVRLGTRRPCYMQPGRCRPARPPGPADSAGAVADRRASGTPVVSGTARRIDEIGPAAWRAEWERAAPLPIFADHPQASTAPTTCSHPWCEASACRTARPRTDCHAAPWPGAPNPCTRGAPRSACTRSSAI